MNIESENGAILAGYTRELMAVSIAREVHIRVKPDTDITKFSFMAYDCDNCVMTQFAAHHWRFEEIKE